MHQQKENSVSSLTHIPSMDKTRMKILQIQDRMDFAGSPKKSRQLTYYPRIEFAAVKKSLIDAKNTTTASNPNDQRAERIPVVARPRSANAVRPRSGKNKYQMKEFDRLHQSTNQSEKLREDDSRRPSTSSTISSSTKISAHQHQQFSSTCGSMKLFRQSTRSNNAGIAGQIGMERNLTHGQHVTRCAEDSDVELKENRPGTAPAVLNVSDHSTAKQHRRSSSSARPNPFVASAVPNAKSVTPFMRPAMAQINVGVGPDNGIEVFRQQQMEQLSYNIKKLSPTYMAIKQHEQAKRDLENCGEHAIDARFEIGQPLRSRRSLLIIEGQFDSTKGSDGAIFDNGNQENQSSPEDERKKTPVKTGVNLGGLLFAATKAIQEHRTDADHIFNKQDGNIRFSSLSTLKSSLPRGSANHFASNQVGPSVNCPGSPTSRTFHSPVKMEFTSARRAPYIVRTTERKLEDFQMAEQASKAAAAAAAEAANLAFAEARAAAGMQRSGTATAWAAGGGTKTECAEEGEASRKPSQQSQAASESSWKKGTNVAVAAQKSEAQPPAAAPKLGSILKPTSKTGFAINSQGRSDGPNHVKYNFSSTAPLQSDVFSEDLPAPTKRTNTLYRNTSVGGADNFRFNRSKTMKKFLQ